MSFLSAIPVIALLAMLPVLLSLRPVAGVREFSASCALSAASAGALTVAAALQAPVAAMFGYAGLAVSLFFVLQGLRRFLALSIPARFVWCSRSRAACSASSSLSAATTARPPA